MDLELPRGESSTLRSEAEKIRAIVTKSIRPRCDALYFQKSIDGRPARRDRGESPEKVVREGKVPSAWFLEQTGVKGLRRGDIQVAHYHADLVYNDGTGMAEDFAR